MLIFNGKPSDASVALLQEFVDHIRTCLYEEYNDAAGQLAYDEGEYIGAQWYTEELLLEVIGLDFPDLTHENWCRMNRAFLPKNPPRSDTKLTPRSTFSISIW